MQNALDLAIKKAENIEGCPGYNNKYPAYMSNAAWNNFLDGMEKSAKEQYGKGNGGELNPGKDGTPPKMASYGSSSRMIYKCSKDQIKNGFRFEYKLPTTVGGVANLDGYFERETRDIYIEAKCREPYVSKRNIIELKYQDLYEKISGKGVTIEIVSENVMVYNKKTNKYVRKMQVNFSTTKGEGEDGSVSIKHFDIKQMICHLAGIATKVLTYPTDRDIHFLYFCYNPKDLVFEKSTKKQGIVKIYNEMLEEIKGIDFNELFGAILKYLNVNGKIPHKQATDEDIERYIKNFKFEICDQTDYAQKLG